MRILWHDENDNPIPDEAVIPIYKNNEKYYEEIKLKDIKEPKIKNKFQHDHRIMCRDGKVRTIKEYTEYLEYLENEDGAENS